MTEEATQPTSIDALEPRMRLEGTIKEIGVHGAVVDVGLASDGLLHISQLDPDSNIDRVADVVQPGDHVTVWVTNVDPEQNLLSLTMVEPPDVIWSELEEGQTLTGTVTRIESYGAFVEIGAERPGLLHVREMSSGYVEHPSKVVSVGEEVEVSVLEVDRQRRRIDLSMKADEPKVSEPEPKETSEEEEEEASQTSMEIALERAYIDREQGEQSAPSRSERQQEQSDFSERQEILKRTLEQHSEDE